MLNHVVETSHLAAVIAAEIGADVQVAKMGGLLHDIGKAVDHEVEGPHAAIGASIAQRHNLSPKVINAIAAHHQEVEYTCMEAPIVQIADAISASRPGARGESMDTYVKRLEDLQAIAESFTGVERSFAVQAGREVRILVRPEEIDDLTASRLARDIVQQDRGTADLPGPDQGDGDPRDAGRGIRQVTRTAAVFGSRAARGLAVILLGLALAACSPAASVAPSATAVPVADTERGAHVAATAAPTPSPSTATASASAQPDPAIGLKIAAPYELTPLDPALEATLAAQLAQLGGARKPRRASAGARSSPMASRRDTCR